MNPHSLTAARRAMGFCLFCSSFQHPLYPYSGTGPAAPNVINLPLPAGCDGGRVLSCLEGGYDLEALAASVQAHLEALLESGASPV